MAPTTSLSGTTFSIWPSTAGPGPCGFQLPPWTPLGRANAAARVKTAQSPTARRARPGRVSMLELLLVMSRVLSVGDILMDVPVKGDGGFNAGSDADSEARDQPSGARHRRRRGASARLENPRTARERADLLK